MQSEFGNFEEEDLGKSYDTKLIKRLLLKARPYTWWFVLSIAVVMLLTGFNLVIPYVTKITIDRYIVPEKKTAHARPDMSDDARYLTIELLDARQRQLVLKHAQFFEISDTHAKIRLDHLKQIPAHDLRVIREKDLSGLTFAAMLLLAVVCLNYFTSYLQMVIMEYTGQKIMHDLRMEIFTHIQGLSLAFFSQNPVGRLVTRTTNDVQNMHEMFTSVFSFIFRDIFLLAGIAVVLLMLDFKLALITFTVLPFIFLASFVFAHAARNAYRTIRIKIAEINTRFSETVQGIRVLKLFNREPQNFASFRQLNHDTYIANMQQVHVFAIYLPVIEILSAVVLALIIYHGGQGVIGHRVSLGTLAAFIFYMKMFFRPIRDMAEKFNIMQNALASAERIFLILDQPEETTGLPATPNTAIPFVREQIDRIDFSRVSFEYQPGQTVLNDISFSVKKGESVAIVGPTGAGKTSLINLIMRFYNPTEGEIVINGKNIQMLQPSLLRSKMALVTQDPFLFSATVRDNILFGRQDLNEKEFEHVLEVAHCQDVIERLPQRADTLLAEGGASISSGERQLISIARAFAKNPDVIILDEATSYIDTDTEQKIQHALSNLMQNRTALIIAHRLSTVRSADTIIVLHHGRLIEQGTYQELMEKKGFYYSLERIRNE